MRKFTSIVVASLIFLISWVSAYSGEQATDKTINKVAMGWGGEGVYVWVNESITPLQNCASTTFVMSPNTPLFKENLSVLLSAFHSRSKVQLYVDGCAGDAMSLKAVAVYR